MPLHHPFEVVGYHSCDKKIGLAVLNGELKLRPSQNNWDWLGWGIYFWEQNPERALDYAIKCAVGRQKFSGKTETPFVIGAIIELGNCLNLVEPQSLRIVKEGYRQLVEIMKQGGIPVPKNKNHNRELDCAVIQNIHASNKKIAGAPSYDSVRSAFQEDEPLYESSGFTHGLHIEVCVRHPDQVKGYFLPQPVEKFNPFIKQEFDKKKFQNLYARHT